MALRLYNARSRAIEPFTTREANVVRIYVCGLTPSAQAHLGHARSFLFFDVLRRYLVYLGYRVIYVQNVTDIDDRSIAAAQAEGVDWREVIERHYAVFTEAMRRLNVQPPDHEPRATGYLDEITSLIADLIDREHAYVVDGDGVYFRVASFPRYGELAGRHIDELLAGARVAIDEAKEDPLDFALWKFARPHEPSWPAPWGAGRPGWHIECSAMSKALLGLPIDIHGGGSDLIFPHHENEIAQTESLYGPPMARFWMHAGLLMYEGRKMSKSLGNFEPIDSLLRRHDPQAIRLLFLQTGYRKPMNFTEDALIAATTGIRRLLEAYDACSNAPMTSNRPHPEAEARLLEFQRRYEIALDDDMNTSLALATLFQLAGEHRTWIEADAAPLAARLLNTGMSILGIEPGRRTVQEEQPKQESDLSQRESILPILQASIADEDRAVLDLADVTSADEAVARITAARASARAERNFARADRLRLLLTSVGLSITDTMSIAGSSPP